MYSVLVVILIELAFLIVLFLLVKKLLNEIPKSKTIKEQEKQNERK